MFIVSFMLHSPSFRDWSTKSYPEEVKLKARTQNHYIFTFTFHIFAFYSKFGCKPVSSVRRLRGIWETNFGWNRSHLFFRKLFCTYRLSSMIYIDHPTMIVDMSGYEVIRRSTMCARDIHIPHTDTLMLSATQDV